MKNIIFIAPPAAGKGTQSALVEEAYHLPHISTGDILREASLAQNELGSYLLNVLSSGGLVKDDIIYDLLKKRLSQPDCQNGYVLDGFPRTVEQAKQYEEILRELNQELGYVIVLDVDEKSLEKRITCRRICENCEAVYNINDSKQAPKQESICDLCQGRLYQRNDDNIESFHYRYQTYLEKTHPLLDYYREKGVLYIINGDRDASEIFKDIKKIIGEGD